MKTAYIIDQLEKHKIVLPALLNSQEPGGHLWKASPDTWCLLEVTCHLVDEEIDDFRTRLRTALAPQTHPFIPIDPVGWVKSRNYMGQNFESKITDWITEREKSLDWLRGLENPDWQSAFVHDQLGAMSAGKILANWLAHDYMHIRQILRIKHAYLTEVSGQDLSYAGKW
ncbi:MAG: DinB family protein [Roseivirga sp.]|nr:DinB family protein [Roseivirga sp.]